MSILIVTDLIPNTSVSQKFKIFKTINVAAIRPYIYKNGTILDGNLMLRVLKGATVIATKLINFTEINSEIPETYAHGYIKFEFGQLPLQIDENQTEQEYTLELSMINHTLSAANYISFAKDWDDSKYSVYGTVTTSLNQPNGFEIFEYK